MTTKVAFNDFGPRPWGVDCLEAAIEDGLSDVDAGRVFDADTVFAELIAELTLMCASPSE